ncbi:hypothetical protein IMG5_119230 [Ichthyophthirius multifiliis]|uniref:Transmembrane protein n=1 Tax=Ichthyophthirius multifiliis TaxID=5932 RepID=G0QUT2_ICHMU|nr:hypothetical protein IMG5_119230 [Ichthyophthirius multifiliis]EGR31012.1 hypothetical protein IMG5_119230 [Ichthyophthirius multifiliis]|eukprot:XP_004034498.1 hypothetical protein IMG5_119230 [Ichthyophthirius multifiliis]
MLYVFKWTQIFLNVQMRIVVQEITLYLLLYNPIQKKTIKTKQNYNQLKNIYKSNMILPCVLNVIHITLLNSSIVLITIIVIIAFIPGRINHKKKQTFFPYYFSMISFLISLKQYQLNFVPNVVYLYKKQADVSI